MPPRPDGTDGNDHHYRMVIAQRYQMMADAREPIVKLLHTHVVCSLVKLSWHLLPTLLDAKAAHITVPLWVAGLVLGEVALLALFGQVKLGKPRESLRLLKAFNLAQAALCANVTINGFLYHNEELGRSLTKYAPLWQRLAATHGLFVPLNVVKGFELFMDLTTFAFLFLATLVTHKYVVAKMDVAKASRESVVAKREAEKLQAELVASTPGGGGEEDEAPQAVPLTAAGGEESAARTRAPRRRHA